MSTMRVGLVLSGGGAKGAYQVGVVKALSELGAQVDAVAGASIGALNGAILASAPSLREGANRMEEVWLTLAESSPLSVKTPNYISLLVSAGLRLNGMSYINGFVQLAKSNFGTQIPGWLMAWADVAEHLNAGLFSDSPLHRLMGKYLDEDALQQGLPLYAALYRSRGAVADILSCMLAELGFGDSPEAECFHVQALPKEQQIRALLGSAALPLLFAPKEINNVLYSDGGQGGWASLQGNTPIKPLLQAGYKIIIVTHLSDGSLWSRHDFPDATILEIRPRSSITRAGGVKDLLGFDASKIPSWMEQGYEDTIHCVSRLIPALEARGAWRVSEKVLSQSEKSLTQIDDEMATAIARLR